MSTLPPEGLPTVEELDALMRLLDDETPEVRARVGERLMHCDGDLSDWLAGRAVVLGEAERVVLECLLRPARRVVLEREWVVPVAGLAALRDDWEMLESLLRLLSDFLHDGITVRPSLSDALDMLAEDAAGQDVSCAAELAEFLFKDGMLVGNDDLEDPRNADLAWVMAHGRSDSIGLSAVYLMVARRMGFEVEGVDFPDHFLCRIFEDGVSIIIDCIDGGYAHVQDALIMRDDFGRLERAKIKGVADTGMLLLRMMNALTKNLRDDGRLSDARLIRKLRSTLR